jgi:hypothetical protein
MKASADSMTEIDEDSHEGERRLHDGDRRGEPRGLRCLPDGEQRPAAPYGGSGEGAVLAQAASP